MLKCRYHQVKSTFSLKYGGQVAYMKTNPKFSLLETVIEANFEENGARGLGVNHKIPKHLTSLLYFPPSYLIHKWTET